MTWEDENPAAVIDTETDPPIVVTRYSTPEEASWYIDYLWDHGGDYIRAKIDRGGYGVDVIEPKKSRHRIPEKVAHPARMSYTRKSVKPLNVNDPGRKATNMPPRGRRAAAEPVAEEVQEEGLFDHHLTKNLSPTMSDYADWFHENVTDIDELGKTDPGRLLALGSTLYPHFQKSDLNQSRRAARKTERAGAAAEEPEEAPAPARKGRAAAKTAAAKPAAAAPAPARGRRGRAATATAEAPY